MKRIIFFLMCVVLSTSLSAQENDKQNDGSRIEALKIAYLTKKLDLTPEEAQRFWPVYNNYANEIRQTRTEQRTRKVPELEVEEKILGIRKKYNSEFTRTLGAGKVNILFKSEKDFGNFVQKELAERRQMRQLQLNKERIRR